MNHTAMLKVVIVMQWVLGLLLAGTAIYLLSLTRSREILAEPDSADTVHGLLIGAMVLGIPAVITLIAAVGLWKGQFWGWVLSVATDVGMLGVLVYSILEDNDGNGELIAATASFLVPLVLLLLPAVRKAYWKVARPAAN